MLRLLLLFAADRASFPADDFAFHLDLSLPRGSAYMGHTGCVVVSVSQYHFKQSVRIKLALRRPHMFVFRCISVIF